MSVDPGELQAKLRDIHYDISISSGFDEYKQLERRTGIQQIEDEFVAGQMAVERLRSHGESPERLWRRDGSIKIQDILAEMAETKKLLEDAHKDTEVESDRAKVGREPNWRLFMLGQLKKPQVLITKPRSTLDLALELRQAIERLWIHSEILFESLHESVRDRESSRSISIRHGAVTFYRAYHRSTTQCELDLDLLRDRRMPSGLQTTSYPAFDPSTLSFTKYLADLGISLSSIYGL